MWGGLYMSHSRAEWRKQYDEMRLDFAFNGVDMDFPAGDQDDPRIPWSYDYQISVLQIRHSQRSAALGAIGTPVPFPWNPVDYKIAQQIAQQRALQAYQRAMLAQQASMQSQQGIMQSQQGTIQSQQGTIQSQQGPIKSQQGPMQAQQGSIQSQQGHMQAHQGPMLAQKGLLMQSQQGPMQAQQGLLMQSQQGPMQARQGPMQVQQGLLMQSQQGPMQAQQGPMQAQQGLLMQSQQGPMQAQQGLLMQSQQGPMQAQQGLLMQSQQRPMQAQQGLLMQSQQSVAALEAKGFAVRNSWSFAMKIGYSNNMNQQLREPDVPAPRALWGYEDLPPVAQSGAQTQNQGNYNNGSHVQQYTQSQNQSLYNSEAEAHAQQYYLAVMRNGGSRNSFEEARANGVQRMDQQSTSAYAHWAQQNSHVRMQRNDEDGFPEVGQWNADDMKRNGNSVPAKCRYEDKMESSKPETMAQIVAKYSQLDKRDALGKHGSNSQNEMPLFVCRHCKEVILADHYSYQCIKEEKGRSKRPELRQHKCKMCQRAGDISHAEHRP